MRCTPDSTNCWFLAIIIVAMMLSSSFPLEKKANDFGTYNGGVIKMYAARHEGFSEYLHTSIHEWAHHVYETRLNRSEWIEWDGLVEQDGLESGYPFLFANSAAPDVEEEFCQCAAHYWMGLYDWCSADKMMFILEVWS